MNKRTFLFGMATVLTFGVAASKPAQTALEVRIDHVAPTGQVQVSMHNTGEAPLRLWRGKYGIARWRLLHIAAIGGQLRTYYEDPDQISDARPLYLEVSPGKPLHDRLDLTSSFWLPRGEARSDETIWATGDTLIVIYDVPISADAEKLGVWHGVVAAKAVVQ